MVNIGGGWSILLALVLVAGGAGLYFLRTLRPALARDHDIFFAAVGLLCGAILLFQGWRLDPILIFGQTLLTGTAIFFAVESIRLRGVATEQAKREMPIVDEERPVSRVYKAELDDLELYEERQPVTRRIRGTRETRSGYEDDYYEDEVRRRPTGRSNGGSVERLEPGDRPRKRRPRPEGRSSEGDQDSSNLSDTRPVRRNRTDSTRTAASRTNGDLPPRSRRNRPTQDSSTSSTTSRSSFQSDDDYVDYQPLNTLDEEDDNSSNFDH